MSRALIFANGELNYPEKIRALVLPEDLILAADGGARHAQAIGITPSIIIGDMDSLSPAQVNEYARQGVQIKRFPPAKDETDLELAVQDALDAGCNPVLILCAFGGRLDQLLGNIMLMGNSRAIEVDIRLEDGVTEVMFVRSQFVIHGGAGDTVSLIPWNGPAEGVTTTGLAYPLLDEPLYPFRTRSISNVMLSETASVSLKSGLLLCIHIRKE